MKMAFKKKRHTNTYKRSRKQTSETMNEMYKQYQMKPIKQRKTGNERTETEEKSKPNYTKAAHCKADPLYNNRVYNPMDPGPSRIKTKNTR